MTNIIYDTESEFLKKLAITRFNNQFGRSLNPTLFGIRSITPKTDYRLGYELTSDKSDDFLIIRIYFNITNVDNLSGYTLDVLPDANNVEAGGDEVWVSHGTIDEFYIVNRIYTFGLIDATTAENSIIARDGKALMTMDGFILAYRV